jgi:hypothetical protein
VKLIDFGIAKAASSHMQTQVGTVKGKFSYMAPEYLREKLDHRVDIWAVGVIAHELLANRRLFDADDDFKVIDMVRSLEIEPPSTYNEDVPPDLDAVVMTALQRDPTQRWQSAGAMRNALANAAAELQTVVTNAQLLEWVEWTFSQKPPGEGSELSQLITILDTPSRPAVKIRPRAPDEPTIQGRKSSQRGAVKAEADKGDKPLKGEKTKAERRAAKAAQSAPPPAGEGRYFARALKAFVTPKAGVAAVKKAFSTPRVGAAMVQRRSAGRRFLSTLVFLLVLGGIGVGLAAWLWGWPFDLQQLLLG